MTKTLQRDRARIFRKNGKSIKEIADLLDENKSTVSYWCRDISLSKKQIEHLANKRNIFGVQALLKAAEKQRSVRLVNETVALQRGRKAVGKLSKRDVFIAGLGLYWGEGYKKGSKEFGFTNSDPLMITFYLTWLSSVFKVKKEDVILRVSINQTHEHRIQKVLSFWSKVTSVPASQFTKPSLISSVSKKKYLDEDMHFGTLRIKVRRGALLKQQVLGSIDALTSQIYSNSSNTSRYK